MDKKEPSAIDLEPHQWTARVDDVEQPKPPEPFFGDGLLYGIKTVVMVLVAAVILNWWRGY